MWLKGAFLTSVGKAAVCQHCDCCSKVFSHNIVIKRKENESAFSENALEAFSLDHAQLSLAFHHPEASICSFHRYPEDYY